MRNSTRLWSPFLKRWLHKTEVAVLLGFPVTEDFAKAAGLDKPFPNSSISQLGIHTGGHSA